MRTRRGTPRLCQRCDARSPPSRRMCPHGSSRTRKGSNRTGGRSSRSPTSPLVPATRRKRSEHARLLSPVRWPRLSANRPPHHDADVDERNLEDDEHEDGFPHRVGHVAEQSNAMIRDGLIGNCRDAAGNCPQPSTSHLGVAPDGSLHKPHTGVARVPGLFTAALPSTRAAFKETP